MLAGMYAEMFYIRPYPLDQTAWLPALSNAIEPIFSIIGIEVPSIEQQFVEEDGVVIRFSGRFELRPTPGILLAPLRLLMLSMRYDPIRWQADPLLTEAQSRARALEARNLSDLSWEGLLTIVREAQALVLPLAGEIRRRYLPRAVLAAGLLQVILRLLGREDESGPLFSGIESTTLEANRALEGLAAQVRSNPVLADIFARYEADELGTALEVQPAARSFLAELSSFMDIYGHREIVLSTVLQPTWKDAPDLVLGIIKGLARTEPRRETGKSAWEAARDRLLKHPLLRFSPLRSSVLGLLTEARCLLQIRESTHYNATRILPILRRTLLEMGRRLTGMGVLDIPTDVFHLKFDELESMRVTMPPSPQVAADLRAKVLRRKERRAALEGTPLIDPRLYRQPDTGDSSLLRGTAGSPGVAEGPVRIIRNASEFGNLRSGEVLVAPYTNPAWTLLFQQAAAVVVDGGAAGSHAAIVAREYGLPAVMGTVTGTQKLHDGEWVRVDGYHGTVQLIRSRDPGLES
jgi:pyruvate,water dikinase